MENIGRGWESMESLWNVGVGAGFQETDKSSLSSLAQPGGLV